MPDIPVGGVPYIPPPPGEPEGTAQTPVPGQTHDIVLGGVGFTLYRANTDDNPSKVYTSEAVDYTYQPSFVPRNNGDGGFADDQQDFYSYCTQRDFSGGEGQRYFRKGSADNGYWRGGNILPNVPGKVRVVPSPVYGAYTGSTFALGGTQQTQYVKSTGQIGGANDPGDALVRIGVPTSGSTMLMQYSVDGGGTWTTQIVSGTSVAVKDTMDSCLGDDGYIYVLEGSRTTTQSAVHRIKGPSLTTAAWDNWAATPGQANCICWYKGVVYTADSKGRMNAITPTTGAILATVTDFSGGGNGGGIILQLLATPEGIYILYLSATGQYKVYLWPGSGEAAEVMNLPRGWKQNLSVETGVWPDRTASGIFAMNSQAMVWSEGVLYVSGLMPGRDHQQTRRGEALYHSALYYYSSGNSGFVWEDAEAPRYHHAWGASATGLIGNGVIVWADGQNGRVMAYDPSTGGVWCLAGGDVFMAAQLIMGGTTTGTITAAIASDSGTSLGATGITAPLPGSIILNQNLRGTSADERALVLGSGGFSNATPFNLLRGWASTYGITATFATTGHTIQIEQAPAFPPTRFAFDFTNDSLLWDYQGIPVTAGMPMLVGGNLQPALKMRVDDVGALGVPLGSNGVYPNSWLTTSIFDFDSTVDKWFQDIELEYDSSQFLGRIDESIGGAIYGWVSIEGRSYSKAHDPWVFAISDEFHPLDGTDTPTSTNIVSGTVSTAASIQVTLASTASFGIGTLVYTDGFSDIEYGMVTAVAGATVTIGRRWFTGRGVTGVGKTAGVGVDGDFTGWSTGSIIYKHPPITSLIPVDILGSGRNVQFHFEFVAGATSSTFRLSLGPILKKVRVRAIPTQRAVRRHDYQIAMFNRQPRISAGNVANVPLETRTPAQMKQDLDELLQQENPTVVVSDATMSAVDCAFILDDCKVREVRPNEYIAYVSVRELMSS